MHLFKTASVLTISTIWLSMVACPAASFLHPKHSAAPTQSDHEKSDKSSISNHLEKALRESVSKVGLLDKRDETRGLALVYFEPGDLLIPIQAAADVLEAFYTGIAINAHGPWANISPRVWIRITSGTLRLLMTATEGNTIPWGFVSWFALEMLRLAERGYTGLYTANFVDSTAGNGVWISLYRCAIGPPTDPAVVGTPAKIASCLNPQAPSWFPSSGKPHAR